MNNGSIQSDKVNDSADIKLSSDTHTHIHTHTHTHTHTHNTTQHTHTQYPILIKSVVLGKLYWWRLEMGTKTPVLDRAYNITKEKNHEYLQNIHIFIQNRHG